MKIKKQFIHSLAAVALLAGLYNGVQTLCAQDAPALQVSGTVLVDFNSTNASSTDDVTLSPTNGVYWNNVFTVAEATGGAVLPLNGTDEPMQLTDTAGKASGWTLTINQLGRYGFNVNSIPDEDRWDGPYPAEVSSFPSTALADGFRISGSASVTFSGLDTHETYNLLTYGANTEWDLGIQTNTLTVGTSPSPASVSFNALNNATAVAAWTNIVPGAGGKIAFTITMTKTNAGALNFLELTASKNSASSAPAQAAKP